MLGLGRFRGAERRFWQLPEGVFVTAVGYAGPLTAQGFPGVTTQIRPLDTFYVAESDHQQSLAKNPGGYCGIGGTDVTCPSGTGVAA